MIEIESLTARIERAEEQARMDDLVGAEERIEYTIPAKPNPGLALDFLRQGRKIGPELAISWLIEEAIGADGYDALVRELSEMPDPENGTRVLQDVGQRVQMVVMGGLDGPKA